jgi:protoporphyrinogen oxidase
MKKTEEILILGGGPAGMACAMELHNAGKTSTIIEKEDGVGGLSKTLQFNPTATFPLKCSRCPSVFPL